MSVREAMTVGANGTSPEFYSWFLFGVLGFLIIIWGGWQFIGLLKLKQQKQLDSQGLLINAMRVFIVLILIIGIIAGLQ